MSSLYYFSIFFIVFIFFNFFILMLLKAYIDNKKIENKNKDIILHFDSYISSFNTLLQICFDIIYKDEILIYSLESMSLKEEEVNKISKKFVKLFFKYSGENFIKRFIFFFGSKETLVFVLIDNFITKLADEEILKHSVKTNMI